MEPGIQNHGSWNRNFNGPGMELEKKSKMKLDVIVKDPGRTK